MSLNPTQMLPSNGAVIATASSAAPRLLRPKSYNCRGGAIPTLPEDPGVSAYATQRTAFRRRQAALAAQGGAIFVIGDSQMQALDVSMFSPFAVPFTAGGDTAAGYLNHIVSDYNAMSNCGGVVLQISQNDITGGASQGTVQGYYEQLLAYLTGPLVVIEAYRLTATTWKSGLDTLNAFVRAAVVGRPRCEVVSINDAIVDGAGNLRVELTWQNDGQHVVDPASVALLGARVSSALRRVTAL